jgi:type IV secretion system protein VirB9
MGQERSKQSPVRKKVSDPPPAVATTKQPDIPLTAGAEKAVQLSGSWTSADTTPSKSADGRVMYAYGSGLPVVVCAPLRVCIIELQAGEKIVGEPQIGDSVRWNITPAAYGDGANHTEMLVIKPTEIGLDTNLVVTTDRRSYYMRLVSKQSDYIARTAFTYPADDSAKWRMHIEQQQREDQQQLQQRNERQLLPAMVTADKLNFNYDVSGSVKIRPRRVFDDGSKTYIAMPPDIANKQLPILLVVGADGKDEETNYRVKEQTYIVDRLFDRAKLVLGNGKKAEKVEIARSAKEKG